MNKAKTIVCLSICLMSFWLSGCSDDAELYRPETVVKSASAAVEVLHAAVADGKVVKSVLPVSPDDGGWTIRFTDNTSVVLSAAGNGVSTAYLTIGSDSCWMVSDDYGESYDYLKDEWDNKVHAFRRNLSLEALLRDIVVPNMDDVTKLVDAIAEDNYAHSIAVALCNGSVVTLPKTDNVLLSFAFKADDNDGRVIDDIICCVGMNRIVAMTPYYVDARRLVASFETPVGHQVCVRGVLQESGISVQDFTDGANYQVVSADSMVNNYTVRLRNTGLPTVRIETPGREDITSKTEWLGGVSVTIVNPDGSTDYASDSVEIRGRGNSTWIFPKKPYALKLGKKAEILGMPKHKRWILLANWLDRTLLRNEFAFEISRRTGLEWTPRGRFVEVVLNGRHIGNFYLCEQIRADENRVAIKEMKADDNEGDAVTGGYLMELDNHFDEVNKFRSTRRKLPYMFKSPDDDVLTEPQSQYFQAYIEELEASLMNKDRLIRHEYMNYLDIDSFIDFWFVYELANNSEPSSPKSTFMYKDRLGKLKAGPVWDFDYYTFVRNEHYLVNNSLYYVQLFSDPLFVERVKERWQMQRNAFYLLPDVMRQKARQIRDSERFNHELWPIEGRVVNHDEFDSFEVAVERMINAYYCKLVWLDNQIENVLK